MTFYPTEVHPHLGFVSGREGFFSFKVNEKEPAARNAQARRTLDGSDFDSLIPQEVILDGGKFYDAQLQTGNQRTAQVLGAGHFFGSRPRLQETFDHYEGKQPSRFEFGAWMYQRGRRDRTEIIGPIDPVLDGPDLLGVTKQIAAMAAQQV